jgi:hypothetical protein
VLVCHIYNEGAMAPVEEYSFEGRLEDRQEPFVSCIGIHTTEWRAIA